MILFSPAKINLGLQIIERREDGFHNLQSVMYPVGLCDILEIREADPGTKPLQVQSVRDPVGIRVGKQPL